MPGPSPEYQPGDELTPELAPHITAGGISISGIGQAEYETATGRWVEVDNGFEPAGSYVSAGGATDDERDIQKSIEEGKIPKDAIIKERDAQGKPTRIAVGDEEYYTLASTMHHLGFRQPKEVGANYTYGIHYGKAVPTEETIILTDAQGRPYQRIRRSQLATAGSTFQDIVEQRKYLVPVRDYRGKERLLTPDEVDELDEASGEHQFDLYKRMGIVPSGSKYIETKNGKIAFQLPTIPIKGAEPKEEFVVTDSKGKEYILTSQQAKTWLESDAEGKFAFLKEIGIIPKLAIYEGQEGDAFKYTMGVGLGRQLPGQEAPPLPPSLITQPTQRTIGDIMKESETEAEEWKKGFDEELKGYYSDFYDRTGVPVEIVQAGGLALTITTQTPGPYDDLAILAILAAATGASLVAPQFEKKWRETFSPNNPNPVIREAVKIADDFKTKTGRDVTVEDISFMSKNTGRGFTIPPIPVGEEVRFQEVFTPVAVPITGRLTTPTLTEEERFTGMVAGPGAPAEIVKGGIVAEPPPLERSAWDTITVGDVVVGNISGSKKKALAVKERLVVVEDVETYLIDEMLKAARRKQIDKMIDDAIAAGDRRSYKSKEALRRLRAGQPPTLRERRARRISSEDLEGSYERDSDIEAIDEVLRKKLSGEELRHYGSVHKEYLRKKAALEAARHSYVQSLAPAPLYGGQLSPEIVNAYAVYALNKTLTEPSISTAVQQAYKNAELVMGKAITEGKTEEEAIQAVQSSTQNLLETKLGTSTRTSTQTETETAVQTQTLTKAQIKQLTNTITKTVAKIATKAKTQTRAQTASQTAAQTATKATAAAAKITTTATATQYWKVWKQPVFGFGMSTLPRKEKTKKEQMIKAGITTQPSLIVVLPGLSYGEEKPKKIKRKITHPQKYRSSAYLSQLRG